LLWNYKLNLTTDLKFESVAREVCKSTIAEIKECADELAGKGYLVSCLVDHRGNITEYQCHQYITKMTAIIFSDYRLICGFMDDCKNDINALKCGSIRPGEKDAHSQGEVVACLEKGLVKEAEESDPRIQVSDVCKKAILRVAELSSDDFHLDRHLYFACRDDRERFCENTQAGEGRVYKCLFNHKFEESMSEKCRDALTTRQKLIAQDYKVSYSLAKSCKSDLKKYRCNVENLPRSREARLSYLLMCLESAVHRGRQVSSECQGEMLDYRRMLMEDFSLSPEIILSCRGEIEHHCSGLHRKGRTLHCLMKVIRGEKGNIGLNCQQALCFHAGSRAASSCRSEQHASYVLERVWGQMDEILSCLMEHLYTEKMVEDCEHRLLELQYFISRDWKLDPVLYRKCQGDASRLCHTHGWNETTSDLMPTGAVFSCLYRHAYRTEEQGRRLSRECRAEVQRILHQRAMDVKLDPALQDKCMIDLGKWCSEKTETGQELECLQDHLDDLVVDCRDIVGNLTELESEDIQIEALLMRACEPIIQTFCHEMADNQIDSGDLMECLIQNKHQKEMNEKCAIGVTHFQLVQMKDFRFSYKFKMACKEDVLKLCPNIKKKVDVVICLSTTVRNDTLQDAREQRVSLKCRKQLRVEELEMTEDIRLEPELYEACKSDIKNNCPNVPYGNAQIIECLKENKKRLSNRCHQKVFKLQENEMMDPELDYTLMRVCKQMIKRFCSEADSKNMLQCLKQNKNSEVMDPKCKQMITKRQITQNTDYRLNPVLRKACKQDIPKFCQNILSTAKDDAELEGQVVSCLKLKYADQRLSPDCEDQIRVIIQESALDYRLDPQLQMHCSDEISRLCAEEAAAQEQTGQVEECLKVNLLKIKPEMCKKVAPAEGFSDLAMQVMTSPSKNYILSVITVGICVLFLIGLLCGRITKRVTRELKDREFQRGMVERGYTRDAQQCRVKIKKLRQAYQKIKEANGRSGSEPQTCRFYDQVHAILGGDPTSTPTLSMDMFKVAASCNMEEDFVDEEEGGEEEENGFSASLLRILLGSQDLSLTLEPIPSQGLLFPDPECGEGTSAANASVLPASTLSLRLAAGSTRFCAGIVSTVRHLSIELKMADYSNKLYEQLEQETGIKTGYVKTGSISLAQTQDRLISLKRIASRLSVMGIPCEIMAPKRVAQLHPLINIHDLVGAMYVPEDAVVSSADVSLALANAASRNGVQIHERTSISHVVVQKGCVTGVETDRGQIECQYFVNCAGQWAYELGLSSEEPVSIPLHGCEHFYLLTRPLKKPLESNTPTIVDPDGRIYIRGWQGGILSGGFEKNPKPIFTEGRNQLEIQNLHEDWDHFVHTATNETQQQAVTPHFDEHTTQASPTVLEPVSTQDEAILPTPPTRSDDFLKFQDLFERVTNELRINLEEVSENQHEMTDLLQPTSISKIALPINSAIMDPAKTIWQTTSTLTCKRADRKYFIPSKGSEFLFTHPASTSLVVEAANQKNKHQFPRSTPTVKDSKKLDLLDRKVYASSTLEFWISNYSSVLAKHDHKNYEKLMDFIDDIPESKKKISLKP
ncbi:Golgi apparatus protein 1, partial [Chelonia mydas]